MNNRLGPASLIIASSPRSLTTAFLTFLWGLLSTEFPESCPIILYSSSAPYRDPVCVATLPPRQFNSSIMTHGSKQSIHRALLSPECVAQRASVVHQPTARTLSLKCVMPGARLCGMLQLEYLVCGSGGRLADGRRAKAWFKHCKREWAALRPAVKQGDTHAAQSARRAFNKAKRLAQRKCSSRLNARLWNDLKYNPRRFWTAYRGQHGSSVLPESVSS